MKNLNGVRTFKSQNDYLQNSTRVKKIPISGKPNKALSKTSKPNNINPDDSVKISNQSKNKSSVSDKIKSKANEIKDAGASLIKDASGAIKKAITTPGVLNIPDILGSNRTSDIGLLSDSKISADNALLFFVSGLRVNPFDEGDGGLPEMSKYFNNSENLNWNNTDEILAKIKSNKNNDKPIILVGHGMGGDSVVEISNLLNTPEYGFKKVDLLVTLDSIGFANDIIPQNVLINKNYISDQDYFFNDGPNVARDLSKTKVSNELRTEGHNDLEYSTDIQMDVFSKIQDVLFDYKNNLAAKNLSQKVGESLPNIAKEVHQLPIL